MVVSVGTESLERLNEPGLGNLWRSLLAPVALTIMGVHLLGLTRGRTSVAFHLDRPIEN